MDYAENAVTLDAVAASAGVSRSTVSRVINGGAVSTATLDRVHRALTKVNYVRERAGQETSFGTEVDAVLRSLADPTRRAIVEVLVRRPAAVSSLAARFNLTLPSMMQHLRMLERAGVVTSEKTGRVRTVSLRPGGLDPLHLWLGEQRTTAEHRADRLGIHLSRHISESSS